MPRSYLTIPEMHQVGCSALPIHYTIVGCAGFRATFGPDLFKLSQLPAHYSAALQALNIITVWLEGRSFEPTADLAPRSNAAFYQGWSAPVTTSRAGLQLELSHPDIEAVNLLHWLLFCEPVHTKECSRFAPGACHHTITLVCNCGH